MTAAGAATSRNAVSPIGADRLLQSGFLRASRTLPHRPALDVAGEIFT